jgi:CheY-like chemotaxis protein
MASKRILIADDDRKVAMLMRNWLEIAGYAAEETYSGAAALRRLTDDRFDLALIDYDMRDIQGDRVCSMLRLEPRYRDLPLIIVTAHVERDEKIFQEYGATGVMYKPLEADQFMRKVRQYLGEA